MQRALALHARLCAHIGSLSSPTQRRHRVLSGIWRGGGGEGEGATSAVQGASGRPRPFLIPRPGRVRAAGGTPTRPRRPLHLGCPKASSAAGSKEDLGPIRALRATRIFPKPSK